MQRWPAMFDGDRRLTCDDVCGAWRSDESFRSFWVASLSLVPFEAYCWECPPVNAGTRGRAFECVFLASPSLAGQRPEPEVFAAHFRPECRAIVFGNLGGDAVLVAPCPADNASDFSHLAQFVRTAEPSQQDALWRVVGEAMGARVRADPVWLSTAGHGVAWLHVRLDSRPKYYQHAAYREGWRDGD